MSLRYSWLIAVLTLAACGSGSEQPGSTGTNGSGGSSGVGGNGGSAGQSSSTGGSTSSGGAGGSSGAAGSGGGAGVTASGGTGASSGTGGSGGGTPGCGAIPLTTPLSNQSVMVGTVKRTYELYVPATLDPTKPAPLVFVNHGFTMSGDVMRTLTDYQSLADSEGFIVAFPDGVGSTWNVGTGVCGAGALSSGKADDLGFVQAMTVAIDQHQCVDHVNTFLTGFSMGGYFSNDIACVRPDLVRAVAPHSGGGPPAGCLPGPKPVMILHGTADPLINYNCGVQARDYWVKHNGCATTVDTVTVKGGKCEYNQGCPKGGQVVMCSFTGMGHGWAGHVGGIYGGGTQFDDATKLSWDFFKSQM